MNAIRSSCAGLVLVALWAPAALAQRDTKNTVILNNGQEEAIRHLVGMYEAACQAGRWDDAVSMVQRLVECSPTEVYPPEPAGPGDPATRYLGVRRFALRCLAQLPPAGRAAYEHRFGTAAALLASQARNPADRAAVLDRYLFTRAAEQLAVEEAAAALERGETLRAIGWLEALSQKAPLAELPASWLATLGYGYRESRQMAPLERLAELAAGRRDPVAVGGRTHVLATYLGGLREELRRELDRPRQIEDWPLPGGDPTQGRLAPFDVLAAFARDGEPQWQTKVARPDSRYVTRFDYRAYPRQLQFRPPVGAARMIPAVGDGKVFVSNGLRLEAYDLYNRGQQVWIAHLNPKEHLQTPQDVLQCYTVSYADGAVYANLEVDSGEVTQDLGDRIGIGFKALVQAPMPRRALVKFDAAGGKRLWTSLRPDQGDKALVNRLCMLSAPVVRDGVAYVTGQFFEGMYQVHALAFDANTGDLLWHRHLGSGQQSLNLFGRPYRDVPGSMPALAGSRLFICSNLGFVACVSADDGSVLWVRRYPKVELHVTQDLTLPAVQVSWFSRPPIVAGDRVLFAPTDSHHLLCLDVESGELRWAKEAGETARSERERDHVLIGVANGAVYTAGRTLKRYALDSGNKTHERPLAGEVVAGAGVLTQHAVYLMTRSVSSRQAGSGTLHRFASADLSPIAQRTFRGQECGNVVLAGNCMVLLGENPTESGDHADLSVFFDPDEVRRNYEQLMARAPNEPFAYCAMAAIRHKDGQIAEAMDLYRQALVKAGLSSSLEYRQAAQRARFGLFSIHLDRARAAGQTDAARTELSRARELAVGGAQRVRITEIELEMVCANGRLPQLESFARRMDELDALPPMAIEDSRDVPAAVGVRLRLAMAFERAGRAARAVDLMQELLARYPGTALLPWSGLTAWMGPGVPAREQRVVSDAAARSAIDRLVRDHGPAVYAAHEAQAQARYQSALATPGTGELGELLRHYPNSAIVVDAALLLARRLIEADTLTTPFAQEAREILAGPWTHDLTEARRAEVRYLLFLAFDKDGIYPSAKQILVELAERYAGHTVPGDPPIDLAAFTQAQLARDEYRRVQMLSPLASMDLSSQPLRQAWTIDLQGGSHGVRLSRPLGPAPSQQAGLFFVIDGMRLAAHESATGRQLWELRAPSLILETGWLAGRLAYWTKRGDLRAVDPATGAVVWEHQLAWDDCEAQVGHGQVLLVGRAADEGRMALVDGATGSRVWDAPLPFLEPSRPLIGKRHAIVWGGRPAMRLVAVELATGNLHEPLELEPRALVVAAPQLVTAQDHLVVPVGPRRLAVLDLATLQRVREIALAQDLKDKGLVAGETRFFVDLVDGTLQGYSHTGDRLWDVPLGPTVKVFQRLPDRDLLYLLSTESYLKRQDPPGTQMVAYDQATGAFRWGTDLGSPTQDVALLLSERYVLAQVVLPQVRRQPSGHALVAVDRQEGRKPLELLLAREVSASLITVVLAGEEVVVCMARQHLVGYRR